MVEHLLCKQGVIGSIPFASTTPTFQIKALTHSARPHARRRSRRTKAEEPSRFRQYFDLRSSWRKPSEAIPTHRSLTNEKAEINKQRQCWFGWRTDTEKRLYISKFRLPEKVDVDLPNQATKIWVMIVSDAL